MMPKGPSGRRDQLLGLDVCLSVREQNDSLHAILRLDPYQSASLIETELDAAGAHCTSLTLEEMFVELAGGGS
jgi:hypothetical protein